jgi:hypothetical protein
MSTTPPDDLKTAEKNLKRSRRALPVGVVFAALVGLLLWLANRYWGLPAWIAWLVFAFAAFTAVGDAINILYLTRRLAGRSRRGSGSCGAVDGGDAAP